MLQDRDGSEAWADWHVVAGLPLRSIRDHLAYPRNALKDPGLLAFRDRILAGARTNLPS